jgi:hypothetical protein
MENQTHEPETHGITTKDNDNKQQIQTKDKKLLNTKADVLAKLDYDRYCYSNI